MKTKRANPHSKLATPLLEGQGTKNIPATARAARRRALVVGINDYQGDINDLPSCRRDAEAFAAVLRTQLGFTEISVLLDRDASVARVKGGLEWLFADVSSEDRVVFYYSGHGTQNLVNGEKEEYLVLHDGLLQDNEISRRTQVLPDGVFTMVFDSCFSGGMEKRLFEIVENPTASAWKAIAGGSAIPTERARVKAYLPDPKVLRELVDFDESHRKVGSLVWGDELRLPGCVAKSGAKTGSEMGQVPIRGLLLSACDENEVASASSSATQGMSAFTFALLVALERLGSGAPTTALLVQSTSILRSLGFHQTPRLKAPGACAGMADAPFINLPRIHGSGAKEVSFTGWGGLDPFGWNRPWGGAPWPVSGLAGDWIRTAAALKGDDSTGATKFLGIDPAILIPAVVQVVTALAKNQAGAPDKSLLGDALRLAGSVIKGPSETSAASKLFGIDDAILIPAIVHVVTALAKNPTGGSDKSLLGDAFRLAGSVIKGRPDSNGASKLFGIDDAILIPAIVHVVTALAKSQAGGPDKSLLGDALRLAGSVIKGRPDSNGASKLFGIDDAILIPIVAQVVTALAKQDRFNDRPAMSTDDAGGVPAWLHPDRAMTA